MKKFVKIFRKNSIKNFSFRHKISQLLCIFERSLMTNLKFIFYEILIIVAKFRAGFSEKYAKNENYLILAETIEER